VEALLLAELAALAPDVLDAVVVGAATDPARCLALARGLHALGAGGEARAVLEHGRGLAGDGELAPPRTPQEPGPHRAKP
jgi:hypothetical protein